VLAIEWWRTPMGKLDSTDSTDSMDSRDTKAQKADGRLVKGMRTKAAIIQSAIELFTVNGFDKTQTSEIAKAAGYAESTVFLHFKNKRGLVLAIMQDFYLDLIDGANLILRTTDDSEEQLLALVRHYLVELAKEWQVVRLFGNHARYTGDETFDQFTQYNRVYTSLYIDIFERLKSDGVFRSDIDSRQLRDMLFGAIEHYAIANFSKESTPDIGAFIDGTFAILFDGARKRRLAAQPFSEGEGISGAGIKGAGIHGEGINGEEIEGKLDRILALLTNRKGVHT
jgi:AcrR family transcriptional regulator